MIGHAYDTKSDVNAVRTLKSFAPVNRNTSDPRPHNDYAVEMYASAVNTHTTDGALWLV